MPSSPTSSPDGDRAAHETTRSRSSTARAPRCKMSPPPSPFTRRRARWGAARRSRSMTEALRSTSREIAGTFLKIGATAYGGPAITGVMQAEIQERRQWIGKPRFLEGLGLVYVLPGATMVQLAMFLGYQRAGWWGGMLAGVCFTAPAFVVMLVLAAAYAAFGVSPLLRGALYGLGPVVLAIFVSALFRLGKSAVRSWAHALIAATAAMAAL